MKLNKLMCLVGLTGIVTTTAIGGGNFFLNEQKKEKDIKEKHEHNNNTRLRRCSWCGEELPNGNTTISTNYLTNNDLINAFKEECKVINDLVSNFVKTKITKKKVKNINDITNDYYNFFNIPKNTTIKTQTFSHNTTVFFGNQLSNNVVFPNNIFYSTPQVNQYFITINTNSFSFYYNQNSQTFNISFSGNLSYISGYNKFYLRIPQRVTTQHETQKGCVETISTLIYPEDLQKDTNWTMEDLSDFLNSYDGSDFRKIEIKLTDIATPISINSANGNENNSTSRYKSLTTWSEKKWYDIPLENKFYQYANLIKNKYPNKKYNEVDKDTWEDFKSVFDIKTNDWFIESDYDIFGTYSMWDLFGKFEINNIKTFTQSNVDKKTDSFEINFYGTNKSTLLKSKLPIKFQTNFDNQKYIDENINEVKQLLNLSIKTDSNNYYQFLKKDILKTDDIKQFINKPNDGDNGEFSIQTINDSIVVKNKTKLYTITFSNFKLDKTNNKLTYQLDYKNDIELNNEFFNNQFDYQIYDGNGNLTEQKERWNKTENIEILDLFDSSLENNEKLKEISFVELNQDNLDTYINFNSKYLGNQKPDNLTINYDYENKLVNINWDFDNGYQFTKTLNTDLFNTNYLDELKTNLTNQFNNLDFSSLNNNYFNLTATQINNVILKQFNSKLKNNISFRISFDNSKLNQEVLDFKNDYVDTNSNDIANKKYNGKIRVEAVNNNDNQKSFATFDFDINQTFNNIDLEYINPKFNEIDLVDYNNVNNTITKQEILMMLDNPKNLLKTVLSFDIDKLTLENNNYDYQIKNTSINKNMIEIKTSVINTTNNQLITDKTFKIDLKNFKNSQDILDNFVNEKEKLIVEQKFDVYEAFSNGKFNQNKFWFKQNSNRENISVEIVENQENYTVIYNEKFGGTTTKTYSKNISNNNNGINKPSNPENTITDNSLIYIGVGTGLLMIFLITLIVIVRKKTKNNLKKLASKKTNNEL